MTILGGSYRKRQRKEAAHFSSDKPELLNRHTRLNRIHDKETLNVNIQVENQLPTKGIS